MGEAKRRKQAGTPSSRRTGNRGLIIGIAAVVAIVVVAGLYFLTSAPEPASDTLPVAAPDAQPFPAQLDQYGVSVGDENAPVVVREFADYQCPACGRFSEASQRLKQEYVEHARETHPGSRKALRAVGRGRKELQSTQQAPCLSGGRK